MNTKGFREVQFVLNRGTSQPEGPEPQDSQGSRPISDADDDDDDFCNKTVGGWK